MQKRLEYLRDPVDCVLAFLKGLYDFYKPHYFIYVFGRRAHVTITHEGIKIDAENVEVLDEHWDRFFNLYGEDY